jgi:hypothetical protein
MANLIWPTENDVNGGTTYDGRAITEVGWQNLFWIGKTTGAGGTRQGMNQFGLNYVRDGLTYSSASGLDATFTAGECVISGYYCDLDSGIVTLPASSTSYVFMQLTTSGGKVTGAALYDQLSSVTTVPPLSVLLAEVVTGTATVSSTNDMRGFSPNHKLVSLASGLGNYNLMLGFEPSLVWGLNTAPTYFMCFGDSSTTNKVFGTGVFTMQVYGISLPSAFTANTSELIALP